jgi:hypothetical protein
VGRFRFSAILHSNHTFLLAPICASLFVGFKVRVECLAHSPLLEGVRVIGRLDERRGRSLLLNNFHGYFVLTKSLNNFQFYTAFFKSPCTQVGNRATRRGSLIEPHSVQIPGYCKSSEEDKNKAKLSLCLTN